MSDFDITCEQEAQRLRPREFQLIRTVMYDKYGVDLEGKEVLVAARLGKKMREVGLSSLTQYYELVQKDLTGKAMTSMADALFTNHTSFFRESQHFDFLRKVIVPELGPTAPIRIWSAACSSGEEPYSIAFTLMEELDAAAPSRVRILATDISTTVLATAERGLYPASRFQHISADRLRRHLLKGFGTSEGNYLVKKETRALVEFRRLNLMEDFSKLGHFSVIFCRNVMIYFDQKTQQTLVNNLAARLEPGGYLLIGHAESLNGIKHPLTYLSPATYRKPLGAHRSSNRRSKP
jgi:chemotaxis protein methyltransferase CheR